MNPPIHLAVNALMGVALYRVNVIESPGLLALFIGAGWLIDIDHVFYTVIKHKTFSFKKIARIEKDAGKNMQARLYILHSPEFNLALAISSIFFHILLIFLLSNLIHIILDIIAHYKHHKDLRFIKEWSLIYHLIQ